MFNGVIIMVMACLTMLPMLSPIKTSTMIAMTSLLMSMTIYSKMSMMFSPSMLVISFTSGMMIVFCYCSMMTKYESKNNMSSLMVLLVLMMVSISYSETEMKSFSKAKNISSSLNSPFSLMGVMFILVGMWCINKTILKPNKPLMESY